VVIFLRNQALREGGALRGGIVRFFGTVEAVHKSGPAYDEVWRRLIEPEKKNDPQKKGYAVLIKTERVEDLNSKPVTLP
jgi:hypothetical protein